MSAWITLDAGATSRVALCQNQSNTTTWFALGNTSGGVLYADVSNQFATVRRYAPATAVGDVRGAGRKHVVGTWDGSANAIRLWVNGTEYPQTISTGTPNLTTPSHAWVGCYSYNGTTQLFWPGEIDQVVLYFSPDADGLWGQTEVNELYGGGYTINPASITTAASHGYNMGEGASGGASSLTIPDVIGATNITGTNMTQDDNVVAA